MTSSVQKTHFQWARCLADDQLLKVKSVLLLKKLKIFSYVSTRYDNVNHPGLSTVGIPFQRIVSGLSPRSFDAPALQQKEKVLRPKLFFFQFLFTSFGDSSVWCLLMDLYLNKQVSL